MKKFFKIVFFLLVTVMAMYGFAKFTGAVIVNSTINSTTIGATTPSTVAATTLTSSTSAQFNGSVLNNGTGFKHVRGTTCTTASGVNGECATTVTWPTPAFPDASYTSGCSVLSGAGTVQYIYTGTQTATTMSIQIMNTPGNTGATSGTFECWAFHD